jgi:alpha-1,2-mannosyltransferase
VNQAPKSSLERTAIAILITTSFGLFAGVACAALTASRVVWVLVAAAVPILASASIARRLPVEFDGLFNKRALLCLLWLALALAAVGRTAGLALYMADTQQPYASAMWFDKFYTNHSCFSGYWKAAQLARAGLENIYDTNLYDGKEGRFELDDFLYPPQFLILPQAGLAFGANFLQLRAAWFALDAALVAAVMLALCAWIGGAAGRLAGLCLPAAWLGMPTLLTLQIGNFQIAAIAVSVLAMLLFERKQAAVGGALLGFAVLKIFPGILCVYLLFNRQWRALFWTLLFSLIYIVIAYSVFGYKPFADFLSYQLPRMADGEVWAWLESANATAAMNDSVPGIVLKLRMLGLSGMDRHLMAIIAWAWSAAIVLMTWMAATHGGTAPRLHKVGVFIALLGLAALHSPFVPDEQGLFPALWLWSVVAGSVATSGKRMGIVAALWLFLSAAMPFDRANGESEVFAVLAVSSASQLLAIGFMFWTLVGYKRSESVLVTRSAGPPILEIR